MNKFIHLVRHGLNKRIKSKAFLIANIIIGIILIGVTNIPTLINLFNNEENTNFEITTNFLVVNETNDNNILFTIENMFEDYNEEDSNLIFVFEETDNIDINLFYNEDNIYEGLIIINKLNSLYVLTVEDKSINPSVKIYIEIILPELNRYIYKLENPGFGNEIDNSLIFFNKDPNLGDELVNQIIAGIGPLFIVPALMIITLGIQYVGTDIIEEKSTKAIEVIISSVKPTIHFLSKITYVLIFLLIQMGIFLLISIIGLLLNGLMVGFDSWTIILSSLGSLDIVGTIFITLITSIIGTVLYLVIASFIASLAVNQEDFQQIQAPMMIIIMFGYIGAITATMSGSHTLIILLSYIPFTAPFMLPTAYLIGFIGVVEIIISIIILVIAIALVSLLFAPMYRASILNYDQSKLWKRIRNSFRNTKSLGKKKRND